MPALLLVVYTLGSPLLHGQPVTTPAPLKLSVSALGFDKGVEKSDITLIIEEFAESRLYPLLPYVFFGETNDQLPARYGMLTMMQTAEYRIQNYYKAKMVPFYHQILNIIGSRMRDTFPDATATLIGCNDNSRAEKSSKRLSMRRAETVRNYLRDVWGIAPERLKIVARNSPGKPSGAVASDILGTRDAAEENRRVEIESAEWGVLAPVELHDTIKTANPPVIRFRMSVEPASEVRDWRLVVKQGNKLLWEALAKGPLREYKDWVVAETPDKMPATEAEVVYELTVTDVRNNRHTVSGRFAVQQKPIYKKRRDTCIADKEIERYSLILFDFNRYEIGSSNLKIIEMIAGRIAPDEVQTIEVRGYTDRMGDSLDNHVLSVHRASSVASLLGPKVRDVIGRGERHYPPGSMTLETPDSAIRYIHDNDLPEGRFYSRTVDVMAEIPIQGGCPEDKRVDAK